MNPEIFDDIAIEKIAGSQFGIALDIENVIARQIPVGASATATVFLTRKKQLYAYITAKSSKMVLADVRKLVARMGLKPAIFIPPKGRPNYFDEVGREHFKMVFPGRTHITSDDLTYYRTLAPYNPALVQIAEVPDGWIRQYDSDARGSWRPSVKFAYRRISTS